MDDRYKFGDRVFAKVKGYQPWPAQIYRKLYTGDMVEKYKVGFYGTRDEAVVNVRWIYPYTTETVEKYGKKGTSSKLFAKAMDEIQANVLMRSRMDSEETGDSSRKRAKQKKKENSAKYSVYKVTYQPDAASENYVEKVNQGDDIHATSDTTAGFNFAPKLSSSNVSTSPSNGSEQFRVAMVTDLDLTFQSESASSAEPRQKPDENSGIAKYSASKVTNKSDASTANYTEEVNKGDDAQASNETTASFNFTKNLYSNNVSKNLLNRFEEFRQVATLTDVTFQCVSASSAEPVVFHAHKVVLAAISPYFLELFKDGESTYGIPWPPVAVDQILNYMYIGRLPSINQDNLELLIDLAEMLKLPDLFQECRKNLKMMLTPKNYRRFKNVLQKLAPQDDIFIQIKCLDFENYCRTIDFTGLTLDKVEEILAYRDPVIGPIPAILKYCGIFKWVEADFRTREKDLWTLLRFVNLEDVPAETVKSCMMKLKNFRKVEATENLEEPYIWLWEQNKLLAGSDDLWNPVVKETIQL